MDVLTRQKFIQLTLRRVKPGSGSTHIFLKTRTWIKQVTDLRKVLGVPYVIVGGVATRLYMPERITDDLESSFMNQPPRKRIYTCLSSKLEG